MMRICELGHLAPQTSPSALRPPTFKLTHCTYARHICVWVRFSAPLVGVRDVGVSSSTALSTRTPLPRNQVEAGREYNREAPGCCREPALRRPPIRPEANERGSDEMRVLLFEDD